MLVLSPHDSELRQDPLNRIKESVKREADDAFKDAAALAKRLKELVSTSKLTLAAKDELVKAVDKVTAAVTSSLPFIVDQYQEAAEKVGAKAKAEMDAYATSIVHRLGARALAKLNAEEPAAITEASQPRV